MTRRARPRLAATAGRRSVTGRPSSRKPPGFHAKWRWCWLRGRAASPPRASTRTTSPQNPLARSSTTMPELDLDLRVRAAAGGRRRTRRGCRGRRPSWQLCQAGAAPPGQSLPLSAVRDGVNGWRAGRARSAARSGARALSDLGSLGEVVTGGRHPAEGVVGGGRALVTFGGPTRSGNRLGPSDQPLERRQRPARARRSTAERRRRRRRHPHSPAALGTSRASASPASARPTAWAGESPHRARAAPASRNGLSSRGRSTSARWRRGGDRGPHRCGRQRTRRGQVRRGRGRLSPSRRSSRRGRVRRSTTTGHVRRRRART